MVIHGKLRVKRSFLERVGFVQGLGKPGRIHEGEERCRCYKQYRRWEQKLCVCAYLFTEQMLVSS